MIGIGLPALGVGRSGYVELVLLPGGFSRVGRSVAGVGSTVVAADRAGAVPAVKTLLGEVVASKSIDVCVLQSQAWTSLRASQGIQMDRAVPIFEPELRVLSRTVSCSSRTAVPKHFVTLRSPSQSSLLFRAPSNCLMERRLREGIVVEWSCEVAVARGILK